MVACEFDPLAGSGIGRHGDRERPLQTAVGGHDLAPNPHDDSRRHRAVMARDETTHDIGLTARPEGGAVGALRRAHLCGEARARDQGVVDPLVEGIDLAPDLVQRCRWRIHFLA